MYQSILNRFDAVFPVREESRSSALAAWLDRSIYLFIFLLALAAPVSIAATQAAWLLGMLAWAIRFFVRPRPRLFRTPIDLAIWGFLAWCLISCVFSYAPDLSFDRVRVVTVFLIAYLVSQNVRDKKTVKFLAGALIVSTLAAVGWTFAERAAGRGVQVYGVRPDSALAAAGVQSGDTILRVDGKRIRQPEDLTGALEQNGRAKINYNRIDWDFPPVEIRRDKLLPGATANEKLGFERWQPWRSWRAAGFYSHYTTYSEVLQLVMALAFGLFVAQKRKNSRLGWLLIFSLAAMFAALVLTATRASQIGFIIAAAAILLLGANRKVLLGAVALSLPLALAAGIYLQQSRQVGYLDRSDGSISWRETVYREGFELLVKSPRHLLVGVGIDSVKRYKCDWGLFANCTLPPGHFHSTPLQLAVECGLPALLLWFLALFRYGKSLLQVIKRKSSDNAENGILLGALGALGGFVTSGMVHYNLGDSEVAMMFYLIMGLALVLIRGRRASANL